MRPIVAIMFHSAGLANHAWRSRHISEPLDLLSMKLKVIRKAGFETVGMSWAALNPKATNNSIFLTFDDGYLDNWVHVFPLFKKLNQCATIFVTPEFVDPRDIVRPQMCADRINDKKHKADGCCAGFLSWPEMREMEKSGLVDIQSHVLTHTWYFKGPRIEDFWHPGAATKPGGPVWMLWNKFPAFKPFYLTKTSEYEKAIPYGTPIYEYGRSLETRRYFPEEDGLQNELVEHVNEHGRVEFFERDRDWRNRLHSIVETYRRKNRKKEGRFETEKEYHCRVRHELSESKKMLEKNLNKKVYGVCWPGGGVNEDVVRIARQVGYKYFTLPSKWKKRDAPEICNDMIPRVGSFSSIYVKGIKLGQPTSLEFKWYLKRHQGKKMYKLLARVSQLFRLMLKAIEIWRR